MATWNNENKATSTWNPLARHGKDIVIGDVANLTFNDPMYADGTLVKDVTFDQSQATSWSEPSKNSATFTNENRS